MKSIRILFLGVLLIGLIFSQKAEARIDGAEYARITVDDVDYEFVVYKQLKPELYDLLRTLDGDKYARQVLLHNMPQREIFIGDGDAVRWLIITEDDEWVEELP